MKIELLIILKALGLYTFVWLFENHNKFTWLPKQIKILLNFYQKYVEILQNFLTNSFFGIIVLVFGISLSYFVFIASRDLELNQIILGDPIKTFLFDSFASLLISAICSYFLNQISQQISKKIVLKISVLFAVSLSAAISNHPIIKDISVYTILWQSAYLTFFKLAIPQLIRDFKDKKILKIFAFFHIFSFLLVSTLTFFNLEGNNFLWIVLGFILMFYFSHLYDKTKILLNILGIRR